MDIDPNRLSSALKDLYAAALEPSDRMLLANRLAAAFGATSCLVHTRDSGPVGVSVVAATDNCTAFLPDYASYWSSRDAWAERGALMLGRGFFGEEVVTAAELLTAEWYNDLLRWHEIHHLVAAVFEVDAGVTGVIGIHRPADAASFVDHDRTMMNILVPHLRQALRLIRRVGSIERGQRLGFEALASLSVAAIVVGAGNRVRLMNSAAERIMNAQLGIRVLHGQLTLADPRLDDRLKTATSRAALAPFGRSLFAGETIAVPTEDGLPMSVVVSPLPHDVTSSSPLEPLAAVFISEPNSVAEPQYELLKGAYGLTPAEARALIAVLNGRRPADYAAETGLSLNTVKSQIKAVFAKTGCHSQAELVRRVQGYPLMRMIQE